MGGTAKAEEHVNEYICIAKAENDSAKKQEAGSHRGWTPEAEVSCMSTEEMSRRKL